MSRRSINSDDLELRQINNDDVVESSPVESNNTNIQPQQPPINMNELKPPRRNPHLVSWIWAMMLLAGGCLLFYLIHLNDHSLPTVVTRDQAEKNRNLFSGERSKASLQRLANLGPRVVGDGVNEVYAPNLIEEEAHAARRSAHVSQAIHVERQIGNGSYQLGFKPSFTNIYNNIQNVIVRVDGQDGKHSILVNCHYDTVPGVDGASDNAISCAVMLELLRVLSQSTVRLKHNIVFLFNGAEEVPLQGSHLFLQHKWRREARIVLNLEAAGSGGRSILFQSGPMNAWIFKYYAKYAPYPHGQVLAEEMFQGGFIPSDTDFRIFRDFGNMTGLDFAFTRNGYVYHTIYDTENYIPTGSHQHLGDNTLALLKSLGNAPELEDMEANSGGQMVYYDYLGWFMVSYSIGGGIALNIITVIFAILSIIVFIGRLKKWSWLPESTPIEGKNFERITIPALIDKFRPEPKNNENANANNQEYHVVGGVNNVPKPPPVEGVQQTESGTTMENNVNENTTQGKNPNIPQDSLSKTSILAVFTELSIALAVRVFAMLTAVGITVIIALIIDAGASLAMPWYSNVWLIFPFYWCPCLVIYAIIPHFVDVWRSSKHKLPLNLTAQLNLVAAQIPWILVFFIITCTGLRSSFVFFLPVLSFTIANLVIFLTPLYLSVHTWVWVYLAIHIPALLMNMYIVLLGYVTFIPVMARSGTINGDLYIALVSCIFCIFLTSFVVPLLTLVDRPRIIFALLSAFSVVIVIIALSTGLGHPYRAGPSDPKPQRYWIMHTLREFRNETQHVRLRESGYFVLNLDRNSPRTLPSREKSRLRSLNVDCQEEKYCGLPLYMTRMVPLSSSSSWIPAGPPAQPYLTQLTLPGGRNCDHFTRRCTFKFVLQGPDRMTLTFAPREGATLFDWDIPSPLEASGEWKDRPTYYLHIVRGKMAPTYNVTITFEVSSEQLSGTPIIDIGLAGNHVHHEDQRTIEFQNFLDSLPDWTHRTGWISAYKSYVF